MDPCPQVLLILDETSLVVFRRDRFPLELVVVAVVVVVVVVVVVAVDTLWLHCSITVKNLVVDGVHRSRLKPIGCAACAGAAVLRAEGANCSSSYHFQSAVEGHLRAVAVGAVVAVVTVVAAQ